MVDSIIKGTAIAAGIGAVLNATANVACQRYTIKHGKEIKDNFTTTINALKEQKVPESQLKLLQDRMKPVMDLIKSKKINWKITGKAAGVGAALVGGLYLIYRGIKGMFVK